jgi:PAS domain S-box-containing protein
MAEALASRRLGREVVALSASMTPFGVDPLAARVMQEVGLDIRELPLRTPLDIDVFQVDLVITLGEFDQSCRPRMAGMPPHLHWEIPEPPPSSRTRTGQDPAAAEETVERQPAADPFGAQDGARLEAFRRGRDALDRHLQTLVGSGLLKALFTSRKSLELILDNLLDGVLAHTATRRIFYFNDAAEQITGLSREQILGRDCHEVFPGRFCGGHCFFCEGAERDAKAGTTEPRTTEPRTTVETRFWRPDGEERLLQMHPTPLVDEEGVDVGALIAFQDITELAALKRQIRQQHSLAGIVGKDPKMLALFDLIREVGAVPVSVLIEGESGTGKEMVAAAIHSLSARADQPFVAVNCGALPEGVLESELFGHVKGAFTGAVRDKKGRFELAHGGTIFLDEISELPSHLQVVLLRVLQERTVQPVGGEHPIDVDVRVISATNQSLRKLMEEGRFRRDLFYRLCVVPLEGHFIETVAEETGREGLKVAPQTMELLTRYDWPGNVRELRNAIEYAYVKCRTGIIRPEHLPPEIREPPRPEPDRGAAAPRLTKDQIVMAIARAGGNKKRAAELLGVGRATLYRYLNTYELL